MEKLLEGLTVEQLPEQYQRLAEILGIEKLFRLVEEIGGRETYFPKKDKLLQLIRDEQILKEFNGYNHLELAKKYDLTVRWVRELCRTKEPQQITAFDFLPPKAL